MRLRSEAFIVVVILRAVTTGALDGQTTEVDKADAQSLEHRASGPSNQGRAVSPQIFYNLKVACPTGREILSMDPDPNAYPIVGGQHRPRCFCWVKMLMPEYDSSVLLQDYQDAINNIPFAVKRTKPNWYWKGPAEIRMKWVESTPASGEGGPAGGHKELVPGTGTTEPYYLSGPDKYDSGNFVKDMDTLGLREVFSGDYNSLNYLQKRGLENPEAGTAESRKD
ncbi:hypothetical protein TWF281_001559 [Arthrobotrys megalospora]